MATEYYVEMTDTYAGEANYCWVHRFAVTAKSETHAISKVSRETGFRFRKECDYGDTIRYKAKRACVCAFLEVFDPDRHNETRIKVLT